MDTCNGNDKHIYIFLNCLNQSKFQLNPGCAVLFDVVVGVETGTSCAAPRAEESNVSHCVVITTGPEDEAECLPIPGCCSVSEAELPSECLACC